MPAHACLVIALCTYLFQYPVIECWRSKIIKCILSGTSYNLIQSTKTTTATTLEWFKKQLLHGSRFLPIFRWQNLVTIKYICNVCVYCTHSVHHRLRQYRCTSTPTAYQNRHISISTGWTSSHDLKWPPKVISLTYQKRAITKSFTVHAQNDMLRHSKPNEIFLIRKKDSLLIFYVCFDHSFPICISLGALLACLFIRETF